MRSPCECASRRPSNVIEKKQVVDPIADRRRTKGKEEVDMVCTDATDDCSMGCMNMCLFSPNEVFDNANTHAHTHNHLCCVSLCTIHPRPAGFHNTKLVRNIRVKKNNEMVNKMHKTKTWKDIDFAADRERFDAIVRREKREADRVMRNKAKEEQIVREKEREARSYKTLFDGAEMQSTTAIKEEYASAQDYEDDFM